MMLREVFTTGNYSPTRLRLEAEKALKLIEEGQLTLDVDGAQLIGELLAKVRTGRKLRSCEAGTQPQRHALL